MKAKEQCTPENQTKIFAVVAPKVCRLGVALVAEVHRLCWPSRWTRGSEWRSSARQMGCSRSGLMWSRHQYLQNHSQQLSGPRGPMKRKCCVESKKRRLLFRWGSTYHYVLCRKMTSALKILKKMYKCQNHLQRMGSRRRRLTSFASGFSSNGSFARSTEQPCPRPVSHDTARYRPLCQEEIRFWRQWNE